MSEPILPLAVWQSGTNENSIPANDNALRVEALSRLVISKAITAQPGSPDDGDVYIIPPGATGAQWSTFDPDDIVIYRAGTWYAWGPVQGIVVNLAGDLEQYLGSAGWTSIGGGSGACGVSVVTASGSNLDATGSNACNYTRFTNASAKTYTFDDAETYAVGDEYHGRNVGAGDLTLTEAGSMTLNPPAGGTLVVPQGGTFTVKIVAADEADVFGVTVPA
jgi:hypothetical protein